MIPHFTGRVPHRHDHGACWTSWDWKNTDLPYDGSTGESRRAEVYFYGCVSHTSGHDISPHTSLWSLSLSPALVPYPIFSLFLLSWEESQTPPVRQLGSLSNHYCELYEAPWICGRWIQRPCEGWRVLTRVTTPTTAVEVKLPTQFFKGPPSAADDNTSRAIHSEYTSSQGRQRMQTNQTSRPAACARYFCCSFAPLS